MSNQVSNQNRMASEGRDVRFGGRTVVVHAAFRTDDAPAAYAAIHAAARGPMQRMATTISRLVEPDELAQIPCYHAQPHPVVGAATLINTDEPEDKVAERIRKMLQMHSCAIRVACATVADGSDAWAIIAATK